MWTVLGDADDVRRSEERNKIIAAMRNQTEPLTPSVAADVTGIRPGNVRKLLMSMVASGEVLKHSRGRYIHPENVDKWPLKAAKSNETGDGTCVASLPLGGGNEGNIADAMAPFATSRKEKSNPRVTVVTDVTGY